MIDTKNFDYNNLSRNYIEEPLKVVHRNKKEDLMYEDLLYLVEHCYFEESMRILNCSEDYLRKQLKLHNLKFKKDGRKGLYTKEQKELINYGKLGLTRNEKLEITAARTGFRKISSKKCKDTWKEKIKNGSDLERQEKIKQTKLKKYGNPYYNNYEQIKETNISKYGVITKLITKESLKKSHSKKTIQKQNKSREKTWENKPREEKINQYIKMKETNLKRYGALVATASEKWKSEHPEYKSWFGSEEHFKNMEMLQEKRYYSLKRNGTFNASKPEDQLYESLVEAFVDVKRQYKSKLYPFACDYYIPKYDLYIENQGFPSHGGHPFDPNNVEDLETLKIWKQRSEELSWNGKKKNQYDNYIYVWTELDPKKREVVKQNNLNFLEIFPKDFNNDIDSIVEYVKKLTLQITESCIKCKIDIMEGNKMSKEITEEWRNEEIFGITKGHCLDLCLNTPFPGTEKWSADNPIWDCNVAGSISPKEGYRRLEYLVKAIDNLYWILNKSIDQNRYEDFVRHQKERMNRNDIELVRVIINRFTIAKICPKVTALMPSKFLQIIKDSGIDITCGVYCPMAGFGGIIEGAKRWFKEHSIDSADKIEAYDINPNFCKYYGWIQRDVLAQKVKTDKVVFVCPPFGLKTERWLGTPMERNDEFETNYLDFHDWCKLIREYIDAPNYIFVGPEESGRRLNKNISSGLFTKQFGVRWYSEYSNL